MWNEVTYFFPFCPPRITGFPRKQPPQNRPMVCFGRQLVGRLCSNYSSPPCIYICVVPVMEGKRYNLSLRILPGSDSKWNPITPSPRRPLYCLGSLVAILFTTFTPSTISGGTTSLLVCETRLANGGIMTGCGSLVWLNPITSKWRKIPSLMDPRRCFLYLPTR